MNVNPNVTFLCQHSSFMLEYRDQLSVVYLMMLSLTLVFIGIVIDELEVLNQNSHRQTEENHEKSQDT